MSSLRILLVDDHDSVRRGLRSLLSTRSDWQICAEATDGLDAVDKARALRPDLILMDVSMPRMNGLDAARIIRKEHPEVLILIVSQNDPQLVRHQAIEVATNGFVTKAGLPQDLLPAIDQVLEQRKAASVQPAPQPAKLASPPPIWLASSGTLGVLIQQYDWASTPLGSIDTWPQSLKTSVNLMLNSRHPMWIGWGPEMTFLYNDAYVSVLSLAKHPKSLGRPAREVWSEIWDICGPLADKVFEKGEATFIDDVRLFMNRGEFLEETYYSFSYSPIHDEAGKVAGLFCPSTETTPKVLNARRLRTLSELAAKALVERTTEAACASSFATLAKNPDDIPFALLYLFDNDGRHAFLEQSTGISGDLTRVTLSQIDLDNKSPESLFWRMNQSLNAEKPEVVPLKDLDSVPTGPAGLPVSEALTLPVTSRRQDRPIGFLIAGINPTRRLDSEYQTFLELLAGQFATAIRNARAAEEDRKRAEALAEIDRAKTVFFNNVSHEFRTPLTLMLGPVEDLLSRSHTDLSPSAKNQLELVNRNGSRLLRLVNTLLDFSRIEAGRMQVTYEPTDLSAFTVELASVFRSATERAGLQLILDCPKLDEPVYVDRDMWEKIVLNLISNAFKFTFDGEIAVTLVPAGNSIELRVRDTGVGIPANELPQLFDRFHRVQNTRSRTHEGSGIGLALVQELVRLHGGAVRVESKIGEGSTFIVSVPRGNAHLPADRIGGTRTLASTAVGATPFVEEALGWLPGADPSTSRNELPLGFERLPVPCPPSTTDEKSSTGRPHVLVADDNADMRQYLVRLLAERYDVTAVANGQAALESVRARTPHLILTDVMMPELDGFGLLRELRSDPKTSTIPIILLSARAGEESRIEGIEHGADDYLIKPFSVRELLARVQTHLELARVRKENEHALRQRTAQFETLLNAAPLGVYLVDADLRILQVNPTAHLTFGNIPNLIGRDFDEVIHTLWPRQYADEVVDRFRHTLDTGEPYIVPEHIENRADRGVREIYEWQINRIPLPDGRHGVVCYFRDISRLVEARETIAESGERLTHALSEAVAATAKFRAVFEQTTVFAGIITLDGIVVDANQMCLEACGYRAEDVLGRHFWDCGWWQRSKESRFKVRAGTSQAAQGIPYREILTYHWADGTERLVDFACHPILDSEGQILFLHPTGVDITDLKRAEANYRSLAETLDIQVRDRTAELEQRNWEVLKQSAQLRDLSHRLMQTQDDERRRIARELHDSAGQTLAALGMNIAVIVENAKQDAQLSSVAEDSQQLIRGLSQEIRTTSYLLHPPLLDEIGLSEALLVYIQGLKERSGLDITLAIPQDFGRLSREMELAIFRIVQESLTNIHRHSRNTLAAIRMERGPDGISLEVKDEGKGIAPEKLAEIQSQGGGVGIKGMRERVRQFDGHMNIESNVHGTKISFQFPLPKSAAAETPDAISPSPASSSSAGIQ